MNYAMHRARLKRAENATDIIRIIKPMVRAGSNNFWNLTFPVSHKEQRSLCIVHTSHLENTHTKSFIKTIAWAVSSNFSKIHFSNGQQGKNMAVYRTGFQRAEYPTDTKNIRKPMIWGVPLYSWGRPIVSACSCPTENISAYLVGVLVPLVKSLPTYVKDTDLIRSDSTQLRQVIAFFSLWTSSHFTRLLRTTGDYKRLPIT